ncbi:MAG: fimbrial protein [Rikenellaceae bacterium]|nr:fimbrial protein [Rikenellaceae bacterium]MCL2692660.1 fimbrial protein [Rikenellaceae bacterium]
MKKFLSIILTLCVAAFVAGSCVKTAPENGDDKTRGIPVVVSFDPGATHATRATDPGTSADRNINHLRVMVYNSATGLLMSTGGAAWNFTFDIPPTTMPVPVEITTGVFDFVFIVNGTSDTALNATLNSGVSNISGFYALNIARSAFDADKDIPMVTIIRNVEVKGDDHVAFIDPADGLPREYTGTWPVTVTRAGIRLRLVITLNSYQYGIWDGKTTGIGGIPALSWLLPGMDNSASRVAAYEGFVASETADAELGFISAPDIDGNRTVTYERIILPETLFTPVTDAAKGLSLRVMFNSGAIVKTAAIGLPAGGGYSLARNTLLELRATVEDDDLEITAQILDWNDADLDDIYLGDYRLVVDRTGVEVPATGAPAQIINVYTDHPGGWTLDTSGSPAWLTAVRVGNTVEVTADSNVSAAQLNGSFTIKAGSRTQEIAVRQHATT